MKILLVSSLMLLFLSSLAAQTIPAGNKTQNKQVSPGTRTISPRAIATDGRITSSNQSSTAIIDDINKLFDDMRNAIEAEIQKLKAEAKNRFEDLKRQTQETNAIALQRITWLNVEVARLVAMMDINYKIRPLMNRRDSFQLVVNVLAVTNPLKAAQFRDSIQKLDGQIAAAHAEIPGLSVKVSQYQTEKQQLQNQINGRNALLNQETALLQARLSKLETERLKMLVEVEKGRQNAILQAQKGLENADKQADEQKKREMTDAINKMIQAQADTYNAILASLRN